MEGWKMINLRNGQITELLNNGMRYNPETISISYAILQEKRRIMDFADRTRLMSAIDELDEQILDYLAVELRTPAYDDLLPIKTKRELIKGTLPFYSRLGTVAAVEWIIRTLVGNGTVEEWFEYGGNPYCFRVFIDLPDRPITLEEADQVMRGIFQCKNLRSHLDSVNYTIDLPPTTLYLGGAVGTLTEFGVPEAANIYDFRETLHVGGAVGTLAELGIPEKPNNLDFTGTLHVGGNGGIHAVHTIPPDAAPPPFSIQRNGSVCTIIMNPPEGS